MPLIIMTDHDSYLNNDNKDNIRDDNMNLFEVNKIMKTRNNRLNNGSGWAVVPINIPRGINIVNMTAMYAVFSEPDDFLV